MKGMVYGVCYGGIGSGKKAIPLIFLSCPIMSDIFKGAIVYRANGVQYRLAFGEGLLDPANIIAITMASQATEAGRTLSLEVDAAHEILLEELYIEMQQPVGLDDQLFLNGYQSWTESRLYGPAERIQPLRGPLPHLVNTTGDYTFYKNPHQAGHLHAWSFTSLHVQKEGKTTFWMDTAPETGYTLFEWRVPEGKLVLRKEVGGRLLLGKAMLMQVEILTTVGTEIAQDSLPGFEARQVAAPVSGWTSWYNYYTKIDEGIILENLRAFADRKMPIDFFQIDDGWQPAVGDWMTANSKFPKGMAHIAQQVHAAGYKAGLWLAPLIVAEDAALYHDHPEWLLTHDGERLVEAGFNPGWAGLMHGTYFVLNLDLPEVQAHLRTVFDTVLNVWGYDLVKLDFLFAAALIPCGGKSRGQRMHEAFSMLREWCGDKLILGCGVPLAAAWGQADYCRIGPDIGLSWDLGIARAIHLRERISTQNALHNTINRRHFSDRYFANDPDVFILRASHNKLSAEEKMSLLLINQIFGDLLFTSDAIADYDDATMRLYRSTFPVRPQKILSVTADLESLYRISFQCGSRVYMCISNLGDEPRSVDLPHGRLYRSGEGFISPGQDVTFKPHETRVYLMSGGNEVGIVGSDMHIFPGCEVESLTEGEDGLRLVLHPQASLSGTLVLRAGSGTHGSKVNGRPQQVTMLEGIPLLNLQVQDGKLI